MSDSYARQAAELRRFRRDLAQLTDAELVRVVRGINAVDRAVKVRLEGKGEAMEWLERARERWPGERDAA